jgi:hypothetical protein
MRKDLSDLLRAECTSSTTSSCLPRYLVDWLLYYALHVPELCTEGLHATQLCADVWILSEANRGGADVCGQSQQLLFHGEPVPKCDLFVTYEDHLRKNLWTLLGAPSLRAHSSFLH